MACRLPNNSGGLESDASCPSWCSAWCENHTAIADDIAIVSTEDAMAMARQSARADALFAGMSTGAKLVAAIELGKRLGRETTAVTVMCDSGIKYTSTRLHDDSDARC